MGFPFLAGGGAPRYRIHQSLRFRASNGAFLHRTFGGVGNRKTWAFNWRGKRGQLGTLQALFSIYDASSDNDAALIQFNSSDQLTVAAWFTTWRLTNRVFRDPTAWLDICIVMDTTQATANDRVRVWVNGVQETSFATLNNPSLNADLGVNRASRHEIGRDEYDGTRHFDGYMAEVHFIDGQALTASAFGRINPVTNEWIPIRYSGTYGTNGFYLPFNDAASTTTIGQDRSGNGNNWTSSGISVTAGVTFDQMLDTPTNNYAVLSGIDNSGANTPSNANMRMTLGANSTVNSATIPVASGKWYWEVLPETISSSAMLLGVANVAVSAAQRTGATANGYYYVSDGTKYSNASALSYGSSYGTTNVVGFALDMDAKTITCYRDNVSQGVMYSGLPDVVAPTFSNGTSTGGQVFSVNFGQRAFAYTPPAGFLPLNTANLPTPTIRRGDDAFQATLRTGTGATASVTGYRFAPSLVWIKSRSNGTNHNVFDNVRLQTNGLVTNGPAAEYTDIRSLTAFGASGYSLGDDSGSFGDGVNNNTHAYVDWAWRRGAPYGFDIVTATGTGSNRTIAHGLNAVPHFMIVKNRTGAARNWCAYHRSIVNSQNGGIYPNLTNAWNSDSTLFNNTAPTSSQFTVGTYLSAVSENLVAYLWTSIPGFSLMSSYTGNGSADGPFVWCGFRPRFVLFKRVDSTGDWYIHDTTRSTTNAMGNLLFPNGSGAEFNTGTRLFDFTANGFKPRSADADSNGNGGTYIFAAFAETPFKFANAR